MALSQLTQEQQEVVRAKAQKSRSSRKDVEELLQEAGKGIPGARMPKIRDRLSEMPETARRTYLRAVRGKSPAAALKSFCLMCVGWQRDEVARCTDPACPLYPYRPFK